MDRKRRRTVRHSLIAALLVACIAGAGQLAYMLAPDTMHPIVEEVVSWGAARLGSERLQNSGLADPGTNPFLGGVTPRGAPADSLARGQTPSPPTTVASDVAAAPLHRNTAPEDRRDTVRSNPPPASPGAEPDRDSRAADPGADASVVADPEDTPDHEALPIPAATATPATPAVESVPENRTGWLQIRCEPDAEIWIDGHYRGDSSRGTSIELSAGMHTLECRHPSHKTYYDTVNIVPGEMSIRNVVLEKPVGRLSLHTNEGAEVFVDGVLRGTTPLFAPIELDAGAHLVTLKKAGYNVWNNQIHVDADHTLTLRITLNPIY